MCLFKPTAVVQTMGLLSPTANRKQKDYMEPMLKWWKEEQGVGWIMRMVKQGTTDGSCSLGGSDWMFGKVSSWEDWGAQEKITQWSCAIATHEFVQDLASLAKLWPALL